MKPNRRSLAHSHLVPQRVHQRQFAFCVKPTAAQRRFLPLCVGVCIPPTLFAQSSFPDVCVYLALAFESACSQPFGAAAARGSASAGGSVCESENRLELINKPSAANDADAALRSPCGICIAHDEFALAAFYLRFIWCELSAGNFHHLTGIGL